GSSASSSGIQFRVLDFAAGTASYNFSATSPNLVSLSDATSIETATIEVDSTGRIWMGYERSGSIYVRYSDAPYTTFSAPIQIASGIGSDDIASMVLLPGSVGVFWSNQSTDRFGFRTHVDGTSPTVWTADEI